MRQFFSDLRDFFRKGDMILLLMCLFTSAFGCLIIASTTRHTGSMRYLVVQGTAIALGVIVYALVSSVDADFISEHRMALVVFNSQFLGLLITPFGTDNNSGNRSWLAFPFLPMDIQPAEFCKITYVLVMASVMASHQNRLSSIPSVMHMVLHLGLVAGLNMVVSGDLGVSMIFVFIFIIMAFVGGVKLIWFLLGGGVIVAAFPLIWTQFLTEKQQNRILVLFDSSIDPLGLEERWHAVRSLLSLNGGGLLGQGLFDGNRTQAGALFAQHTDFIFSSIGEEMGYLGCMLVLLLMMLIIGRCIYVGSKSPDYLRKMICYGVAAAMIFQVVSNVGMCIGMTPVVGLTLPFISYGGSSTLSLYAMMGLVSGVYARPTPRSHERYIRPPLRAIDY